MRHEADIDPAEVVSRLREAFLEQPAPAAEERHMAAMAVAFRTASASQKRTFVKKEKDGMLNKLFSLSGPKIAAAFVAGLVVSGSGLAATRTLPSVSDDPVTADVQDETTEVDETGEEAEGAEETDDQAEEGAGEEAGEDPGVPGEAGNAEEAKEHGQTRSTTDCPGFEGNHGAFVSGSTERPRSDAAHSDCGKPEKAVEKSHEGSKEPEGDDGEEGEVESEDEGDQSGQGSEEDAA